MTNAALVHYIKMVSQRYFNQPFTHQAWFNKRLRTTGGRYHLADHHIEINPRFAQPQHSQALLGIVLHELCHYHLHLAGKGYRHRDPDFKRQLAAVGGSRYAPALTVPQVKWHYVCTHCGQRYNRQRRLNVQRFVCGRCGGRLKLSQPAAD